MKQYISTKDIDGIVEIFVTELRKKNIRIENLDIIKNWVIYKIFNYEKSVVLKSKNQKIEYNNIRSWAPGFDLSNNSLFRKFYGRK